MTEELKHSALPWIVGQHPAMTRGWIINPVLFGNKIIRLPECEGGHVALKSKADADLIVKAVNSHAALMEALEEAIEVLIVVFGNPDYLTQSIKWMDKTVGAITQAEKALKDAK